MTAKQLRLRIEAYEAILAEWTKRLPKEPELWPDIVDLEAYRRWLAEQWITCDRRQRRRGMSGDVY